MEGDPIRVMVVDDRADVRRALAEVLENAEDIVVCGQAADVAEARVVADLTDPDVVLLDLRLGDESGIDACRSIRTRDPGTRVLLLTAAPEREAWLASLRAGASGSIGKSARGAQIRAAIRDVAAGHVVGRSVADIGPTTLCDEELALLAALLEGKSDAQIAAELGCPEPAVQQLVMRLSEKLAA